jgi:leucyl aminopeptidase (aminopeptidase T)
MRRFLTSLTLAATTLGSLTFGVDAQSESKGRQFASKLVREVLHARTGDVVVLFADPSSMTLIEDIATNLREVGAFCIVDMGSNRRARLYYQNVPEKYDAQERKDLVKLAEIANGIINIDYPNDPTVTSGVSPARLSRLMNAVTPYNDYVLKHSIPVVDVGNGLMPAAATAKQFGVSEQQLTAVFWEGVNGDYGQIHRDAEAVRAALGAGRGVHITAANGTDFAFTPLAGSALVNDGVISTGDRAKGGAAVQKLLPAGDVLMLPRAGTAHGKIVFGDVNFNGVKVSGMTMHFAGGKLTSMHATGGGGMVRRFYDSGGTGRDLFGSADFGVNRSIRLPDGTWGNGPSMAAGYVTLSIGSNYGLGGTDRSSFYYGSNVPNATVTVGGKKIIDSGRLVSSS